MIDHLVSGRRHSNTVCIQGAKRCNWTGLLVHMLYGLKNMCEEHIHFYNYNPETFLFIMFHSATFIWINRSNEYEPYWKFSFFLSFSWHSSITKENMQQSSRLCLYWWYSFYFKIKKKWRDNEHCSLYNISGIRRSCPFSVWSWISPGLVYSSYRSSPQVQRTKFHLPTTFLLKGIWSDLIKLILNPNPNINNKIQSPSSLLLRT